jgi:hypothetical protein
MLNPFYFFETLRIEEKLSQSISSKPKGIKKAASFLRLLSVFFI